MLIAQVEKQPRELIRRTIDYSCRFDEGQVIMTIDAAVTLENGDEGEVSLMNIDAYILPSGVKIEYYVSLGEDGEIHKITFLAGISDGQVMEDEVEIIVQEL